MSVLVGLEGPGVWRVCYPTLQVLDRKEVAEEFLLGVHPWLGQFWFGFRGFVPLREVLG